MTENPFALLHPVAGVIPPEAEVTRTGRWSYRIIILDGLCEYGPGMGGVVLGWHTIGRKRAERKAKKMLARYVAKQPVERFRVVKASGDGGDDW